VFGNRIAAPPTTERALAEDGIGSPPTKRFPRRPPSQPFAGPPPSVHPSRRRCPRYPSARFSAVFYFIVYCFSHRSSFLSRTTDLSDARRDRAGLYTHVHVGPDREPRPVGRDHLVAGNHGELDDGRVTRTMYSARNRNAMITGKRRTKHTFRTACTRNE